MLFNQVVRKKLPAVRIGNRSEIERRKSVRLRRSLPTEKPRLTQLVRQFGEERPDFIGLRQAFQQAKGIQDGVRIIVSGVADMIETGLDRLIQPGVPDALPAQESDEPHKPVKGRLHR